MRRVPVEGYNLGVGVVVDREVLGCACLVDTNISIQRGGVAVARRVAHEHAIGMLARCGIGIGPLHLSTRQHIVGDDNGVFSVLEDLRIVEEVELFALLASCRVFPFERHGSGSILTRHLRKCHGSGRQRIVAHDFHLYIVDRGRIAQSRTIFAIRRVVAEGEVIGAIGLYLHIGTEIVGGRGVLHDVEHLDAARHSVGGRREQVDVVNRRKPTLEPERHAVGHAFLEAQRRRDEPRVEAHAMVLIHRCTALIIGAAPLVALPNILIVGREPRLVVDLRPIFPRHRVVEILIVGDALRFRLQWSGLCYRLVWRRQ